MPDKLTQLGSCHRALHKKRPWLAVNWKTTILIAVVTLLLYRVQSSESTWRASVGSEASSICVKGKYLYAGRGHGRVSEVVMPPNGLVCGTVGRERRGPQLIERDLSLW